MSIKEHRHGGLGKTPLKFHSSPELEREHRISFATLTQENVINTTRLESFNEYGYSMAPAVDVSP
jgi:hypothetical protein